MRRRALATLLSVVLACGVLGGSREGRSGDAPRRDPPLAVYRGPVATKDVDAFAAWLDRDTVWAEDNTGSESWNNVAYPIWWLEGWSKWVKAAPGRRWIVGIPILPGPLDLSGPTEGDIDLKKPVSLERGANGEYDAHYVRLAKALVAHGLGDTILRPGWEFNGDWYAWRAKGKAEAFAGYWRHLVKAMRSVPGAEHLHFCWNPTLGDQSMPAETAWPGDELVDSIGLDVYDVSWIERTYPWSAGTSVEEIGARRTKVWHEWIDESSRGLRWWVRFAREHGKPLSIVEWGVSEGPDGHGGLDDAAFVDRMNDFVTNPANDVWFHCLFDASASDGHHQLSPGTTKTIFPAASARFRERFGRQRK